MYHDRCACPRALLLMGLLAMTATSDETGATGFFVNQQSIEGHGRAFAGSVAAGNDPSTVFYNPAGMTHLWSEADPSLPAPTQGTIIGAGVVLIVPKSDLDDAGSTAATPGTLGVRFPYTGGDAKDPGSTTAVPHLYAVSRLLDGRVVAGIGVTSPFGLRADYADGWFGRYDATEAELETIDIAPSMAFRITDFLSIGGGVNIQRADSTLELAIPNPFTPGGPSSRTDGEFNVDGDDWTVGYNVGAIIRATSRLNVGIHYRSGIDHDISGTATTKGLTGPLALFNGNVGATAKLELPAIAAAGVAFQSTQALRLYGDFSWFGWSDFDESRIRFDDGSPDVVRKPNFRDTYAISAGADYRLRPWLDLRAGIKYDRTPTRDGFRDTTFADDNRWWITFGGTWRPLKDSRVDFALQHTFIDDTRIDIDRSFFSGTPLASTVNVKSRVSSSSVTAVSIALSYAF